MNNLYSGPEIEYLPRWITPRLQAAAREHRVVVLTGARQVGKSTLLRRAEPFAGWKYLSLDDYDVLRQAETGPEALWAGSHQIILDEVQKAPALLSAVKQAVDSGREPRRFVLSGSANLLLMRQVSESLAGRAVYFVLSPMTLGESYRQPAPTLLSDLMEAKWPPEGVTGTEIGDLAPLLLRGCMPALLSLSGPAAWVEWWEGYAATYLERDLRQISQIDSLVDFRRVMELLALRTGQLVNQSELARDAKISQATVHRYLNLLEATYLLRRLPAFTPGRTARIVKSPKAFWADPGLPVFLAGYFDYAALQSARELGAFFENWVLDHVQVLAELLTPRARMFFWRTTRGQEVDAVIEQGRRLLAVEIKMSETVHFADAEGLSSFLKEYPHAVGGVLIYRGREVRRLGERILAIPVSRFLGVSQRSRS